MRLWLASDIHLEFPQNQVHVPEEPFDVAILAGDIDVGTGAIELIDTVLLPRRVDVIYVLGNHEFYGGIIDDVEAEWARLAADRPRLHLLQDHAVTLGGVRFVGGTLWTDCDGRDDQTMLRLLLGMNDFRMIKKRDAAGNPAPFQPEHAADRFDATVALIRSTLATPFDGPTVVVTHHLPSDLSTPPQFAGSPINGGFRSNLDELIREGRPNLWLHGHTHDACDYHIEDTRVVCEPGGYPGERARKTNRPYQGRLLEL